MKILSIHFKNINSLKGTHKIDFTEPPFDTSPLFAITGPTGSGKSTLLDVISLALFNQVPRLGKISKKEILSKGALLTKNQKEAWASVRYRCKTGTFTSNWSISTNKKNRLRDYEMEIADETGTLLDVKRSRVPAQNEQLIGLNYDQFIKSVLLAQGEFAQFLRAKKDERGALLEKITGTEIYRVLGKKAYERNKAEGEKIKIQQDQIEAHRGELLQDDVLGDFTKKRKNKKKSIAILETRIKKLEKDITLKNTLAKTQKEIEAIEVKHSTENKKMDAFMRVSGLVLRHHEKLRPIADELRAWSILQERISTLGRQSENLSKRKEANLVAARTFMDSAVRFIGKETTPEKVEHDIIGFTENVRALQKIMDDKLSHHSRAKTIVFEQARDTDFSYVPEADNFKKLDLLKSKSEEKLEHYSKLSDMGPNADVEVYRKDLKQNLLKSKQLEKNSLIIAQERTSLKELSAEAKQIEKQRKTLPKDITIAEEKAKRFKAEANELQTSLEIEKLRASLDEHRAQLKKDEPCPLCGSLEHPFAKHLPTDQNTERGLTTLRKESEKWNNVLITAQSKLKVLKDRHEIIEQKFMALTERIQKMGEQQAQLSEGLHLDVDENWEHYTATLQDKLEALTNVETEKKILSKYNQLLPNLKKLYDITLEGKEIRTRLLKMYDGKNINSESQEHIKKWTALEQEKRSIDEQLQELNKELEGKRFENQKLEKLLGQSDYLTDFKNISEARTLLLDERTFNRLQTEKSEINTELNKHAAAIRLLEQQLETAKETEVDESTEALIERFENEQNALKSMRQELNELDRALVNHKEKTEKIAHLKQQIAAEELQMKRWKLLNELIGDAQGKKFNDFAQDLTLRHLVILANIRLEDLSDRYRLDTPVEDEDDGLIVLDDHMGSQRRSVSTLSGGETFLLSLSMALALSDLASSNVEIDSLFIDEGFGTLDPETLDQTLDTLEKLQSESSKTIGIISHVDSLKERIATQIQLERNGQGYSSLRIV